MTDWQKQIDEITVIDNFYPDHTCNDMCVHNSSLNTFDNAFNNAVLFTDKSIIKRWVWAVIQQVKAEERSKIGT